MKKISTWLMLALLLTGAATAQTLSLRTLQLGGGEMPEAWVHGAEEDKPVKVEWLTSQPTQPVLVKHTGTLKFFKWSKNGEGKLEVSDIQSIAFPSGAKEILLLGQMIEGEAKYIALEDRFLNAKFNDWMAINTSIHPVAVRCGDKSSKPVKVNAGKSVLFKPDIEENKGVEMVAMAQRNGELKTFHSTYWPAFKGQRTVIIFYDDGEKMRARRIGDRFIKKQAVADTNLSTE